MNRYMVARLGRLPSAALAASVMLMGTRAVLATPHYYSYLPQYSAAGAQIVGGGINNSNTVAFQTTVDGVTTVYTGSGGHLTKIADSTYTETFYLNEYQGFVTVPYSGIRSTGVDDSGTAYFVATTSASWVFSGTGGALSKIINIGPADYPYNFVTATYSDSGIVAATFYDRTRLIDNGVVTYITDSGAGPYKVVVNNARMLAGTDQDYPGNRLYLSNGSGVWGVALDLDSSIAMEGGVAINNPGTVLFAETHFNATGDALFMMKSGMISTLIDFNSPFQWISSPLLNDSESMAFIAYRDLVKGIYIGPNAVADKLIAIGDSLDGSTITDLSLFKKGLNNSGDIAFVATLADGRSGVYIAEPIPEPSSLALLALGAASLLGARLHSRNAALRRHI